MVNAAKRMRALAVIFNIRNGTAAVTLPPPPNPQLRSVYMRIPTGSYATSKEAGQGQAQPTNTPSAFSETKGARSFWRKHLQRLKYRNPALSVTVETIAKGYNTPTYMSLQFDSPDRSALQRINPKYDLLERRSTSTETNTLISSAARTQRDAEVFEHAAKDTVAPSEDPVVFSRTVTLPLANFPPESIWAWFRQTTACGEGETNEAEAMEYKKVEDFLEGPSKRDRERVKAGIQAMKKEAAELKKAREAAERMSADAA